MNCDQAQTEMIAYHRGELNESEKKRLEAHLAKCPQCRSEIEKARKVLDWTEAASSASVIKGVHSTIETAIKSGASDIHVEPQPDDTLIVRYRIDGVLHQAEIIYSEFRIGYINRIKMMADMNVGETKTMQDGRIPVKLVGDKEYDLRVSSIPFVYGEGIVMRIMDRSSVMLGMDKLGMYDDQLSMIKRLREEPMGMLIVSGLTGTGKTTTAYSMLKEFNHSHIKTVSVEDPIECIIQGVNQIQVNKNMGLTSANALRALLRHDPDIAMVGEIRDAETAILCAHIALTGHLVIGGTLARDVQEAITRLRDFEIEDFLIGSSLLGISSQRLARRICQNCKKEIEVDLNDPVIHAIGITSDDLASHKIYRGGGCDICRHTGYRGRIGIFEILEIDSEISRMISGSASEEEILDKAREKGFISMKDDAKRKVLDGLTSPEEAFRVVWSAWE